MNSNLSIAGDAIFNSLEADLVVYENKNFDSKFFHKLIFSKNMAQLPPSFQDSLHALGENFFIFDEHLLVLFPRVGSTNSSYLFHKKNGLFFDTINRAKNYEFVHKNYKSAAKLYLEASKYAKSEQQMALALEGTGRCQLKAKQYSEALKHYSILVKTYSKILNNSGHPLGIVANLQLSELYKLLDKTEEAYKTLLKLYQNIKEGEWLLNHATYHFFIQEIETLFEKSNPILGSNFDAVWSPEGERLAYVKEKTDPAKGPGYYIRTLFILNQKTGNEIEFAPDFEVRAPQWSPDSLFIMLTGYKMNMKFNKDYNGGLYKIDTENRNVSEIVQFPKAQNWLRDNWSGSVAEWALDGKVIYY